VWHFGALLGLVLYYIQYNYFKSTVHLILGINFGFWALQQNISTKQMLCIYIEGSMNIFIIYIGIIRPQSHFDYINFRVSLVIKIINFNEKKAHLIMFVIFYVDVIYCQSFILPHIYCIFAQNNHFLKWKFTNNHMVFKHGSIYLLTHPQAPWWTQLRVQRWTTKGEEIGVCSLARNTLGVKGRARALRWD